MLNPSMRANVEEALAGEAVAHAKYRYFAKLARELGDEEAARLFELVAEEETAHAFANLTLLYPPGSQSVVELLRLARENELSETTRKYPELLAAAQVELEATASESQKESLRRAQRRFGALAAKETAHLERFEALLDARQGSTKSPA